MVEPTARNGKLLISAMSHCAKVFLGCLAGLLLLVASAPYAAGQNENTGEIRGMVQDSSGGVVPGATVVIRNLKTQTAQTTTTNMTGVYNALFIPIGTYSVSVSKPGFKTAVQSDIAVHRGVAAVDFTLQVGSTATTISVKAPVASVDTETSERSTTIPGYEVRELPTVGQDWTAASGLLPGVSNFGGPLVAANYDQGAGAVVAINGAGTWQSSWLVDGGSITYLGDQNLSQNYKMPLDAVQEVSIQTSNFGAQYSTGTSVFNVITKGGTNRFHGSVFEFLQNDALDSRTAFEPTVPAERWNMYGFTVGGPIKKNKLFFFFSFQYNPWSMPASGIYTFPTAAARSGDFSNPAYPPVYDPNTTTWVNGQASRTQFPNNVIPSNRINSVAKNIQDYIPLPNLAGLVNNYYAVIQERVWEKFYIPKVDYYVSNRQRISVSGSTIPEPSRGGEGPIASIETHVANQLDNRWQVTDNWVFSPTLIGEFHMSMNRWASDLDSATQNQGYPQKLGLLNAPANIFPSINIAGTMNTGVFPGANWRLHEGGYTPSAVISLAKGRHLVKFGGEYNKYYVGTDAGAGVSAGQFYFYGVATWNPSIPGPSVGYADFLLGLPASWNASENPFVCHEDKMAGLFIQDDFKLTPKLTLSFGTRHTFQGGWGEQYNRLGSFDPNLLNPATNTLGAMWFANLTNNGGRTTVENGKYDAWAPRLGFAWSPAKNWVVRGAYGIFDQMWGMDPYSSGAEVRNGVTASGYAQSPDNVTPIFCLSCRAPNLTYTGAKGTLTPAFYNGQWTWYYPRNMPMPYIQQVHFGVQHQFAGFVADVAYVWTKGTHLAFMYDLNQVPADLLGPGNMQVNRPYPQFSTIFDAAHEGLSKYNALQATLRRQYGQGLTLDLNYTWSKCMDTGSSSGWGYDSVDSWQTGSIAANYGLCLSDRPQMFNGGLVYELPFGRGKPFLKQGGLANAVVGGWRIASIFQVSSGIPFTVAMPNNFSGNLGYSWWLPNRIGSGKLSHPTTNEWFDTSDFVQPAPYTLGNSGRDILFGPNYRTLNFSLAKEFAIPPLGEDARLQLRADAINVTNHTNFGMPDRGVGDLNEGVISSVFTGATSANRVIQLGVRLTF